MALISQAIVEGALLVARQVTESASPSPTMPSSTPATTTGAPPADTSVNSTPGSPGGNNNQNNNNAGNSPLLFFVALGFGVVFTNLWIIVGVKYCFRYNARNRAMRVNEDGEPITLENMPRPHRRRREKKLMTMEEVNEKFPMQKYKSWVASRAQEGLPTRGGVSVPPSRANSIRSARGVATELPSKERDSSEVKPATSADAPAAAKDTPETATAAKHEAKQSASGSTVADLKIESSTTPAPVAGQQDQAESTSAQQQKAPRNSDDHGSFEEEDDDHINAALPPELIGSSGDTCAICIDSLDDDEDVRGLTCGHAFHAVCVDPWLTSRRACCPLCKADYYTPKPRPQGADGAAGPDTPGVITVTLPEHAARRSNRQPRSPSTWMSFRSRGRSGTGNDGPARPQLQQNRVDAGMPAGGVSRSGGLFARFRPAAQTGPAAEQTTEATSSTPQSHSRSGGFLSNLRSPFSRHQQQGTSAAADIATPSQLEAGTAASVR